MRLAIISGGSRGLGAELCAQFAQQGFHVVEFSRSGASTDLLTSVKVDLSSPEASRAVIRHTLATLAGEPWQEIVAININPGVMDTGMQASIRRASPADFPDVERFIKHQESGALHAPADVAAAVLRIVGSPALTAGELYSVSDCGC